MHKNEKSTIAQTAHPTQRKSSYSSHFMMHANDCGSALLAVALLKPWLECRPNIVPLDELGWDGFRVEFRLCTAAPDLRQIRYMLEAVDEDMRELSETLDRARDYDGRRRPRHADFTVALTREMEQIAARAAREAYDKDPDAMSGLRHLFMSASCSTYLATAKPVARTTVVRASAHSPVSPAPTTAGSTSRTSASTLAARQVIGYKIRTLKRNGLDVRSTARRYSTMDAIQAAPYLAAIQIQLRHLSWPLSNRPSIQPLSDSRIISFS